MTILLCIWVERKKDFWVFFTWPIQTRFCSWRHMVWKNMLFEEYQNCCLVLGHPDIWIELVYLFRASMLPGFCSRGQMFWRKGCLKNSKSAVLCMTILDIWMEWFEQFRVFLLPRFLLKFICLGVDIVWSTKDSRHGGTFGWLWVHNPKFKGDSNPNDKYVLSERAPWTMNFDTSIINVGWKMGKFWAFKEFNMANIKPPFLIFN